jgi:hypothetical protein
VRNNRWKSRGQTFLDTISVRIAVAVDDLGRWSAVGNCIYDSDDESAEAAVDYLPLEARFNRRVFFVDAEIPLSGV